MGVINTRAASALSTDQSAILEACVKKEEPDETAEEQRASNDNNDNTVDLSPFINSVELTKEKTAEKLSHAKPLLNFKLTQQIDVVGQSRF
ncbi:hypothetical protein EVAR_70787_1 [Eumeta japonica]|uniref:Uncharacterized protein n=1 Tax=Eumeta variegata TaxID=151549 RepID=A0A4C1TAN5_EUMVA|nr:hypothetical protein EVAR_70787_1 [Eumeta japonica]